MWLFRILLALLGFAPPALNFFCRSVRYSINLVYTNKMNIMNKATALNLLKGAKRQEFEIFKNKVYFLSEEDLDAKLLDMYPENAMGDESIEEKRNFLIDSYEKEIGL